MRKMRKLFLHFFRFGTCVSPSVPPPRPPRFRAPCPPIAARRFVRKGGLPPPTGGAMFVFSRPPASPTGRSRKGLALRGAVRTAELRYGRGANCAAAPLVGSRPAPRKESPSRAKPRSAALGRPQATAMRFVRSEERTSESKPIGERCATRGVGRQ